MKTKIVLVSTLLVLMLSGLAFAVSDEVRDEMYRSFWQDRWRSGDLVLIRTDIDRDNDGIIESVEENEYSNDGLLIRSVTSGAENSVQQFTSNTDGYLIKLETNDIDQNTNTDHDYSYASDIVQITFVTTSDAMPGWIFTNVMTDMFDGDDNHIGKETTYMMEPYGTSASDFHHYTYDINGNLIREEWDYLYDGTIDDIRVYSYDSNGNRIRDEYYYPGETTAYKVHIGTYDSDNLCVSTHIDEDNDGIIDGALYYTWEALDEPDADVDGDGDIDGMDSFNIALLFGTYGCAGCPEDLNGDDNVDDQDVSILADSFGD